MIIAIEDKKIVKKVAFRLFINNTITIPIVHMYTLQFPSGNIPIDTQLG